MSSERDFRNNIAEAHNSNCMILPNGTLCSMDSMHTRLNNHVIVLGASGVGKTRSVVIPNILTALGSYIVTDPKGNLYTRYGAYMEERGYRVVRVNLIHPENSNHYNPLYYIKTSDDILKLAHQIVYADGNEHNGSYDPFWDRSSELLLSALIGYLVESGQADQSIYGVIRLLAYIDADALEDGERCEMDDLFDRLREKYYIENGCESWAYQQYQKFRQTPKKTLYTIITCIHTSLGTLDTAEVREMMSDEDIHLESIGQQKTIVFVEISDTDRSKDILANIFYSQAMNTLCAYADERCEDSRLPIPVRFILDDFGTNCRIEGFENMISNIRSRGISATMILQSESQLSAGYGDSAHTIIDNCDTIVYMGGNDIETATSISTRSNKPLRQILNMPVGTNWIFRRGEAPQYSRTVDLSEYNLDSRKSERDDGKSMF